MYAPRTEQEMREYREIAPVRHPRASTITAIKWFIILDWAVIMVQLSYNRFAWAAYLFGLSLALTFALALVLATQRCKECQSYFERFENVDKSNDNYLHYFITCPSCQSFFREDEPRGD